MEPTRNPLGAGKVVAGGVVFLCCVIAASGLAAHGRALSAVVLVGLAFASGLYTQYQRGRYGYGTR